MRRFLAAIMFIFVGLPAQSDPLPSWADTETKASIIEFVESVTTSGSDTYVTPGDRIAVFDNDGTLWSEKPYYFQLIFALDLLRERAKDDPSILSSEALKAANRGDLASLADSGLDGLLEVLAVSHAGMSVTEFQASVRQWLSDARHPSTGLPYDQMVYQPMLELLRYLRDEDFDTWIVSGGGVHFIRTFAEEAYGVSPQHVVGSSGPTKYVDGEVTKLSGIDFVDNEEGKPVGIDSRIGKRPILAVGNSDGDFAMLEYVTKGTGPGLGVFIHHTDSDREFAYDREGQIGVLNRGLDEAKSRGWLIIDMAKDWKEVWPN